MIILEALNKQTIQLEGEKLLTLHQIADIYALPYNLINLLFHKYVRENIIRENKDYYIISKGICLALNIKCEEIREVFISAVGFMQISLELIKMSKAGTQQKIKEEKFKLIMSDFYCNKNQLKFNSQLDHSELIINKTKTDMQHSKVKQNMKIQTINNQSIDTQLNKDEILLWRKKSNKQISKLVHETGLSFEQN